ncbi:MAG: sulfite exporter TauE/SafE family protein [Betaproteobacteria bacterium]
MNDMYFVLAGFFVGTVVGLTGVGGGSLMTPILIFFMGVKPHLAVGTDLLFAAITKTSGTYSLWRKGLVPWRVVVSLCCGSIPASLITLYVLNEVGADSTETQHLITQTLGVALLLTALSLLYKAFKSPAKAPIGISAQAALMGELHPTSLCPAMAPHSALKPQEGAKNSKADELQYEVDPSWSKHPLLTIAFGVVIGCLVTLTSVGAGAIGVTVLMILYPRLPLPRIIAADIAYAVPLTLVAGLGHASIGSVDWPLLAKLTLGSVPGICLGAHFITKTPQRVIRLLLSLLLTWAGSQLVLS